MDREHERSGTDPTGLPMALGAEAERLCATLIDAGGEASLPVLAALADVSVAVARRHVRALVSSGLVVEPTAPGGLYAAAPWPWRGERGELGWQAWARVTSWYLSCAFAAARALRCDALPGAERIEPAPGRPTPAWRDSGEVIDWYQNTHPQTVEALERAVADGDDRQAWRLAVLLSNIAIVVGPAAEWERVLELGRIAAERSPEPGAIAMVGEYFGKLALHHGRLDDAAAAHAAALALRRDAGDPVGVKRAGNGLALVLLRTDAAAAEAQFADALALAEQDGDRFFAALIRLNLASSMRQQGRWRQARPLLEQGVAYLREHGPGYYLANALQTLAATYRAEGDLPRALALAQEAVDEAVTSELPLYLPGPLVELGEIHLALGDPQEAITAFGEARAIHLAYRDTARAASVAARIAAAELEAAAQ
jgi:tetratricopeptide (TPR) repeat protein